VREHVRLDDNLAAIVGTVALFVRSVLRKSFPACRHARGRRVRFRLVRVSRIPGQVHPSSHWAIRRRASDAGIFTQISNDRHHPAFSVRRKFAGPN
jgi:hypothetical protein